MEKCFKVITDEESTIGAAYVGFPKEFLRETCVLFALNQKPQKTFDCQGFQMVVARDGAVDADEIPEIEPENEHP